MVDLSLKRRDYVHLKRSRLHRLNFWTWLPTSLHAWIAAAWDGLTSDEGENEMLGLRTTDFPRNNTKQHETTRNNIQCWHVLTTFDHLSIRCKCCRCGAGTAGTSGGNSCVRASARRSRARCHWPDLQVWGPNIVFMSLLSLLKSIYRLDFL